jgi:hypothetical protein
MASTRSGRSRAKARLRSQGAKLETATISAQGVCPSGQRERAVHPSAQPTSVTAENPLALCARIGICRAVEWHPPEVGGAEQSPAPQPRCEARDGYNFRPGGVPERPKGTGCKPVGSAYGGSNPPAPTVVRTAFLFALLATACTLISAGGSVASKTRRISHSNAGSPSHVMFDGELPICHLDPNWPGFSSKEEAALIGNGPSTCRVDPRELVRLAGPITGPAP